MLRRCLALVFAAVALAVAVSACGGSSSGSSTSEGSAPEHAEAATAVSTEEEAEEPEAEESEEAETPGSELENIMRIQIYGKFGGSRNEFDVAGGTCKIVKINTTPAAVKAGGEAILDHERNASVLVAPVNGKGSKATAKECRQAVAVAIG